MVIECLPMGFQMIESKNVREVAGVLKKADGYFSITWFAEKTGVSWTQAKLVLFRLMAKGLVDGQELPHRGWIFRAKKPELMAPLQAAKEGR